MAIDCAVPRREEDAAPSHSQASITRGLPSIPSIASLHASPSHAYADAPQGFCDMQVAASQLWHPTMHVKCGW